MPDPMLTFGHHLISLLPHPGAARASGGKDHLCKVKAACKSAERIHGVLKLAGRFELAVVPDTPEFFDPELVNTKARNLAWEIIRETPRLQWVIVTRRPDLISSFIPSTWIGKGFQNVCIGYMADSDLDMEGNLQALRNAPVQHRLLLLTPTSPRIDLREQLKSIDWVIFAGKSDDDALAAEIGTSCHQVGVAFHFHRTNVLRENAPPISHHGEDSTGPTHPFGSKINLCRPTLPNLKAAYTEHHATAIATVPEQTIDLCPAVSVTKSTRLTEDFSSVIEPTVEILDPEIIIPESNCQLPVSAYRPAVGADHEDFIRLDQVVRHGLATFLQVGVALAEIRDRDLWHAGGHASWAEYCKVVGGLSKTHANRIITSARITKHISGVAPIGVTPRNEAQVRPLARLKQADQQILAWNRAVERSNGQPTAELIADVVAEIMATESPTDKSKPDAKQRIRQTFAELRNAIEGARFPERVLRLLKDLEKQLKL